MSDEVRPSEPLAETKPICTACNLPMDLQSREPVTWWCGLCRRFFNEEIELIGEKRSKEIL